MPYSVDRALQIAAELERRGRVFYESLAAGCGHPEIARLAQTLAEDEEVHVKTFQQMRDALPDGRRGPELLAEELYAAAEALGKRIIPRPQKVYETVLHPDLDKALEMAIQMESTAISYYSELAAGAAELNTPALLALAAEEKKHLLRLEVLLDRLRSGNQVAADDLIDS